MLWQDGTFALLAIAATLGLLARLIRSRALAVSGTVYAAAVGLAGFVELQRPPLDAPYSSVTGPEVVLPAAVLLLAALDILLTSAVRRARTPSRSPAST